MAGDIVTVPADLGHPGAQKLVVITSMRNMAVQAILIHRRMGPHPGASLLGVALVTKFINRIRLDLGDPKPSMDFVAIRAPDFSFPDWMMRGPARLGPYALMAKIAEVWLRCF